MRLSRKTALPGAVLLGAGWLLAQTVGGDKASIVATPAALAASKENPEAVTRGAKGYAANCASCHGLTAKGIAGKGPDLIRSLLVITDEKGILITPPVKTGHKGLPKLNLTDPEISDVATWLRLQVYGANHRATYAYVDIVTGDPKKGEAYFNTKCGSCHSVTGDLAHFATKGDAHTLQQRWIQPPVGGRGGGTARSRTMVTVTLANGPAVSGVLDRVDDFLISLRDADGNYRSFARESENNPKVAITNPMKAHMDLLPQYKDDDIHNVTAYLVTLK